MGRRYYGQRTPMLDALGSLIGGLLFLLMVAGAVVYYLALAMLLGGVILALVGAVVGVAEIGKRKGAGAAFGASLGLVVVVGGVAALLSTSEWRGSVPKETVLPLAPPSTTFLPENSREPARPPTAEDLAKAERERREWGKKRAGWTHGMWRGLTDVGEANVEEVCVNLAIWDGVNVEDVTNDQADHYRDEARVLLDAARKLFWAKNGDIIPLQRESEVLSRMTYVRMARELAGRSTAPKALTESEQDELDYENEEQAVRSELAEAYRKLDGSRPRVVNAAAPPQPVPDGDRAAKSVMASPDTREYDVPSAGGVIAARPDPKGFDRSGTLTIGFEPPMEPSDANLYNASVHTLWAVFGHSRGTFAPGDFTKAVDPTTGREALVWPVSSPTQSLFVVPIRDTTGKVAKLVVWIGQAGETPNVR